MGFLSAVAPIGQLPAAKAVAGEYPAVIFIGEVGGEGVAGVAGAEAAPDYYGLLGIPLLSFLVRVLMFIDLVIAQFQQGSFVVIGSKLL